ncbi:MAG: ferredoxin domain-containing protein [Proteobacteria bacterium]|nr:ferredoxin domain-containing protein [Pseudomonadota bacterium]MBU4383884.1 ferredoxin domain-containing protein [Pseudomonadota bacterium]MBU4604547.1 ferredoxin domain-containing protein [Pseudomonadota bacterium]
MNLGIALGSAVKTAGMHKNRLTHHVQRRYGRAAHGPGRLGRRHGRTLGHRSQNYFFDRK